MAGSKVCNDSYVTIADEWSTGELVEALRHATYLDKIERIQHQDHSTPNIPSLP